MPDISTTENGLYIFKFRDMDARDWVMEYGPWNLAGRPFILREWRPDMDMLNIQLTSIPIWVKFYNIPLEYWTNTCLGYIASVVGNPLHLDALTENRSKLSFARICIEVGVDCEFPKSVLLDMGNGKFSTIKIEYPWAPQCCSNCKLFGHNLAQCHILKEQITKAGYSVKEAGKEAIITDDERKATLDMRAGYGKDPPGIIDVDDHEIVVVGAAKRTTMGTSEASVPATGGASHPMLSGNTFECLVQLEEECPSEVDKNVEESRLDPNAYAEFS